jgi:CAAX prenyl protease-like protein
MRSHSLVAFVGPFVVFLALLGVIPLVSQPSGQFWRSHPEFWVFPLQTLVCGALLIWWRGSYRFGPFGGAALAIGALAGVIVFLAWISPQWIFGAGARVEGFNPTLVADAPALHAATLGLRFVRLVIVVPFLEEIFWRGCVLRYLVREDFESVPVGAFTWLSFGAVSVAFMFEHARPDWPAALFTGALLNVVAYRTRSLGACVLAHAVANLLLGLYVVRTGQWGFW